MKSLKNPMTNAIYIALITAIYAIIFIVSSEFVFKYDHFLSDSRWSLFIQNKNMKYVGLGMIGVAIIIDTFSALRRKKFDEYLIITLEKIMLFNGSFLNIIFPLSLFILMLHAQLIAVSLTNGAVLIRPGIPDVAVEIVNIVGFFLPDP